MYTIDTNVVIYFFEGDETVVQLLRRAFSGGEIIYVSTVTEIELFSFPPLDENEINKIEDFLSTAVIIPVDSQVARIAGGIRRLYKLNLADSAIAATALLTRTTLLTRNIRDFKKIPGLRAQKI